MQANLARLENSQAKTTAKIRLGKNPLNNMSVVVKNVGAIDPGVNNQQNTDPTQSIGDQGTVRFVYQGVEYVWGPNESKTCSDDLAAAAVTADSRLRRADSRDASLTASQATLRT